MFCNIIERKIILFFGICLDVDLMVFVVEFIIFFICGINWKEKVFKDFMVV